MKKSVFLAILCYILTAVAVVFSIFVIWYTSKIHFLLSIFVTVICILLVGAVIWYAVKFSVQIRNQRNSEDKYEELSCLSHLSVPFDKAYLAKVLSKDNYKCVVGKERTYAYEGYIKLNEASSLMNILLIRTDKISDRIFFNNAVDQILLVHDIPAGSFKVLIIVVVPKADKETKLLYQLNNVYNITKKKYFALYEEKNHLITLGGDKELTSSDFVLGMTMELDKLLQIRENNDGGAN
ncbi:MAG: hypothetical protein LKJ88_03785 [Bacilli bacterium]|jgi:hypothetical protein|nr:hypothetical protein [Bacilli bacterium]